MNTQVGAGSDAFIVYIKAVKNREFGLELGAPARFIIININNNTTKSTMHVGTHGHQHSHSHSHSIPRRPNSDLSRLFVPQAAQKASLKWAHRPTMHNDRETNFNAIKDPFVGLGGKNHHSLTLQLFCLCFPQPFFLHYTIRAHQDT
jgi:hypothetical protein